MSTTLFDDIQIEEYDCVVPKDEMFDLYEDDWESLIESDEIDWKSINY